jgi:hypothetical protein
MSGKGCPLPLMLYVVGLRGITRLDSLGNPILSLLFAPATRPPPCGIASR